jgi:hypothetical protein
VGLGFIQISGEWSLSPDEGKGPLGQNTGLRSHQGAQGWTHMGNRGAKASSYVEELKTSLGFPFDPVLVLD